MKVGKNTLLLFIWIITVSGYGLGNEKDMAKAMAAIPGEESYVLLYNDGTVWEGKYDEGEQALKQIEELADVVKIVNMGETFYALTEAGEVYGWGSNRNYEINWNEGLEDNSIEEYYSTPQKLEGLENIVDIDTRNGKAFALDKNGNLSMWGLLIYWDYKKDYIPGFPEEKKELVEKVSYLSAGVGNFHFFMREDGSVFSIMEDTIFDSQAMDRFIFPVFGAEGRTEGEMLNISKEDLRQGAKGTITLLYELGIQQEVKAVEADEYTVFVYKADNTLWYWENTLSKYHYIKKNPETGSDDYRGIFIQIDVRQILGIEGQEVAPEIIAICAGRRYTLFLTEDGQVFVSEYIYNKEIEECELSFSKLKWENVVSINTDGDSQFMAVDEEGSCYYLSSQYLTRTLNYTDKLRIH